MEWIIRFDLPVSSTLNQCNTKEYYKEITFSRSISDDKSMFFCAHCEFSSSRSALLTAKSLHFNSYIFNRLFSSSTYSNHISKRKGIILGLNLNYHLNNHHYIFKYWDMECFIQEWQYHLLQCRVYSAFMPPYHINWSFTCVNSWQKFKMLSFSTLHSHTHRLHFCMHNSTGSKLKPLLFVQQYFINFLNRHLIDLSNYKMQLQPPTYVVQPVCHSVVAHILFHRQRHHVLSAHLHNSAANQPFQLPVDWSLPAVTLWCLHAVRQLCAVHEADQLISAICNGHSHHMQPSFILTIQSQ